MSSNTREQPLKTFHNSLVIWNQILLNSECQPQSFLSFLVAYPQQRKALTVNYYRCWQHTKMPTMMCGLIHNGSLVTFPLVSLILEHLQHRLFFTILCVFYYCNYRCSSIQMKIFGQQGQNICSILPFQRFVVCKKLF